MPAPGVLLYDGSHADGSPMKPPFEFVDAVRWNELGLVPVIAQDASSGRLLMVAWMNIEALRLSVAEGFAIYWSRSRQKLWRKGEESGHIQRILEIRLDCDGDVLLLKVQQQGGIACHTGRESCFFRLLGDRGWSTVDPVLRDPVAIYGNGHD